MSSQGLQGKIRSASSAVLTRKKRQEKLLAEHRLQTLCYVPETKHQQRQFSTSSVKIRAIVKGVGVCVWLYYNITEIVCGFMKLQSP